MADATFRISTSGATTRLANRMSRRQRDVQNEILEGLEGAARQTVSTLKEFAPVSPPYRTSSPHVSRHRVGRLRDSIGFVGQNRRVRNPHIRVGFTGIDPFIAISAEVSRHGRGPIVAKKRIVPSGLDPRFAIGKKTWLPVPDRGGTVRFRRSVGAWKPAADWVDEAEPIARRRAQRSMDARAKEIRFKIEGQRTFTRNVRFGRLD